MNMCDIYKDPRLLLQLPLPEPHQWLPDVCFSIKLRIRHTEKSACEMSLGDVRWMLLS